MSRDRRECETRELIRYKLEEKARQEKCEKERQEIHAAELEKQFLTVPVDTAITEEEEDRHEAEVVEDIEDNDSDSDWEEVDNDDEVTAKYSTKPLKNFARECDRFNVTDRAAAKLGNALLKDFDIVRKGFTLHLICPTKLR